MLIEQAVFTSVQSDRAYGYHLAGRSPGLADADARELALLGPSHDSLLSNDPRLAVSTNFYPLASGGFCLSRTQTSGAEYSGRGGAAVYTQMLVVPRETMARFANNPFAVLRAALASGAMRVEAHVPAELKPLRLVGRTAAVDLASVAFVAREPGAAAMARLVQAALEHDRLAVAWKGPVEKLFAGFINLLPVECRLDFSFSTGLKFSAGRSTRLSALPADASSWRGLARQGVTILDLNEPDTSDNCNGDSARNGDRATQGWPAFVGQLLSAGKLSFLAAELAKPHPALDCSGLDDLADQARGRLKPRAYTAKQEARQPTPVPGESSSNGQAAAGVRLRADASHHPESGESAASSDSAAALSAATTAVELLSELLATQSPETVNILERVDDLVFEAISGNEKALTQLKTEWPSVVRQLDSKVVEATVGQYIRSTISICDRLTESADQRAQRALAAIDVLGVLFDG